MLIFIDSQGNIVGHTPGGLTQGSSKANVLQLVAPFPTAIASVSFQLPNGIVLGPGLEDGLGETADEYVMTEAFKIPGYGVGGSELTVFNFTCNKQITALAGNLGIQFFLSIGEIIEGADEEPPVYGGYTIAVPMINVPVYNGTRFIPQPTMTADNTDFYSELLEKVSSILINSQEAVAKAGHAERTANRATQTAENAVDIANEVKNRAVLKDPPEDEYGRQAQRIEGTVETDSIIARGIYAEGSIGTDGGIDLSSGAPISIEGTDKDRNDVTYYIKGYHKLDENNDEYLVGIALIGDENSIEGKTNFLGDVIFTKPVSINDTATISKAARFLGGWLGKRTGNSADKMAITLDPDMGIRFDGEHEENYIEDSGVSIKSIHEYEPYPVDTTIIKGIQIAGNPLFIYNYEEEELIAVDRNIILSVLGDIRASGKLTVEGAAEVRGTIYGQSANFTDAYIDGTLEIAGDLNVSGKTTAVDHETLLIKDNIIVTNSDGLNITASGLVINKGNGKAYGILYQPQGDLVYIGEGTYSVSGGIPYFDFYMGQALPLAARSENFPNGEIPIFDAATASFKPSGKTPSNFVEKTAQTAHRVAYINARGEDTTMQIVNDFTDGSKFTVYTIACRNKDGCITVNDPINPLDTVNKRTLENTLRDGGYLHKVEPDEYLESNDLNVLAIDSNGNTRKVRAYRSNAPYTLVMRGADQRAYMQTPSGNDSGRYHIANRLIVDRIAKENGGGTSAIELSASQVYRISGGYRISPNNNETLHECNGVYVISSANPFTIEFYDDDPTVVTKTISAKFIIMSVTSFSDNPDKHSIVCLYYSSLIEAGYTNTSITNSGSILIKNHASGKTVVQYHYTSPIAIKFPGQYET